MLKRISIKNFALIDDIEIDFHEGLSVITGETGSGKSIFLRLSFAIWKEVILILLDIKKRAIVEGDFL